MALFGENFERCPKCGHYEFEEKAVVVLARVSDLPHRVQIRDGAVQFSEAVLQPIERRVRYFCAQCGTELSR